VRIWIRRCGYGTTAAALIALAPLTTTTIARADNPPSVDDTVLDVVDSVLSQGKPAPAAPPPAAPSEVGVLPGT
jgi:hypothetical protein